MVMSWATKVPWPCWVSSWASRPSPALEDWAAGKKRCLRSTEDYVVGEALDFGAGSAGLRQKAGSGRACPEFRNRNKQQWGTYSVVSMRR